MNNLFVDTTNFRIILILENDNSIIDKLFLMNENRMSDHISETLNNFLQKNNLSLKDINNIYLVKGPGSYTGVRIGVTIAKTLMIINKNLNVYSISSLAFQAGLNKCISILDARGGKVYFGIYDKGKIIIPDQVLEIDQFEKLTKNFKDFSRVNYYENIDFEFNYQELKNAKLFIKESSLEKLNPIYIKPFI